MAVAVERGLDRGMAELRLGVLRVRSLCDHIAELLRIKDEILLQAGAPNAAGAAEELFRHAIDWGDARMLFRGSSVARRVLHGCTIDRAGRPRCWVGAGRQQRGS